MKRVKDDDIIGSWVRRGEDGVGDAGIGGWRLVHPIIASDTPLLPVLLLSSNKPGIVLPTGLSSKPKHGVTITPMEKIIAQDRPVLPPSEQNPSRPRYGKLNQNWEFLFDQAHGQIGPFEIEISCYEADFFSLPHDMCDCPRALGAPYLWRWLPLITQGNASYLLKRPPLVENNAGVQLLV